MLPVKKAKGILLVFVCLLCMITILFFAYSISKMWDVGKLFATHPLETCFDSLIYAVYVLLMFLCVAFLLGSTTYVACSGKRSRSGMILAFGLMVSSLSAVVFGWFLAIGMMATGIYSFAFSGFVEDIQIFNVLPATICFSLFYLTVWFLFKLFGKKFVAKQRQQLDNGKKNRGYRRYLQACGLLLSIFTLSFLPISLQYFKTSFGFSPLPQKCHIDVWLHAASVVISGSEFVIGIDLLLDRSKEKISVGALLLSSSHVGFFTIWFCYLLIVAKIFDWGLGNYNVFKVYNGSMLFVLIHRIVSVTLLLLTLRLSNTSAQNDNK